MNSSPISKSLSKTLPVPIPLNIKLAKSFSELKNRIQSGYNLREVVSLIDELRFRTHAEQLEMSHLYEGKIKKHGECWA